MKKNTLRPLLSQGSKYLYFILVVTAMASCGVKKITRNNSTYDTIYEASYAKRFEILGSQDSVILRIHNPWQGASDVSFDYAFPKNPGRVPRIICMSSSHVAFLDAIDACPSIIGVSGKAFITNPKITGSTIPDVGYDNNLNYELLVALKPDYVFVYEVAGENSASTKKIEQLGIKVIYIADYLEQSPLARSEWIVAFGAIMGRREQAETIFREISKSYNQTKDSVATITARKPRVLLNSPYRDVWYIPGDRSYIVQLINDSGGDYLGKGVDDDISRPISTEIAYKMALDADMWLNPSIGAHTLRDIAEANPRFKDLPVVKRGEVYNNNARSTPNGGSDFWESGSLRADVVLLDMAKIFHADYFRDHELFYYKKLE